MSGACEFALALRPGERAADLSASAGDEGLRVGLPQDRRGRILRKPDLRGAEAPQKLHLADNLADVVVVLGARRGSRRRRFCGSFDRAERLSFPDETMTKPFPPGVDDWSHPYHGPDNNPQSKDKVDRRALSDAVPGRAAVRAAAAGVRRRPPAGCSRPSGTWRSRSGRSRGSTSWSPSTATTARSSGSGT